MASPHVAGLGAYILALEGRLNPLLTGRNVCSRLQELALSNSRVLDGGIPELTGRLLTTPNNIIAYNGGGL